MKSKKKTEKCTVLLNGHTLEDHQDKQNSNSSNENEKINYENVEDTPFYIMYKDKEYIVCMGNYRLHEEAFKTKIEAIKYAKQITWNKLMVVIELAVNTLVKKESINNLNIK